jgi:hypothetical protein
MPSTINLRLWHASEFRLRRDAARYLGLVTRVWNSDVGGGERVSYFLCALTNGCRLGTFHNNFGKAIIFHHDDSDDYK